MGCCYSRDKILQDTDIAKNSFISEAKYLKLQTLEEENDPKSNELINYIQDLDISDQWELVKDEDWYKVSKLKGSKYNSEYPISKLWFHLEGRVPLRIILDELNTPEKRMAWDKNFKIYEIIGGDFPRNYTIYYLISVLGYKGDYIEKKIISIWNDKVVVITYSVENENKPPINGINRGTTHLGVTIISLLNERTEITMYNQTEPNSTLGKLFTNLAVGKMGAWCKKYKNAIQKARGAPVLEIEEVEEQEADITASTFDNEPEITEINRIT
ncbi:unnamed protein product [Blepharisma stoltei]|uniref:START domain-containing protein n=1 Tax=Blepharisma stoltei TaxID=1481888 RepID=A0AAU9IJH0_9CILI|nr:unnamed protein product [Blepharisma stoltei]